MQYNILHNQNKIVPKDCGPKCKANKKLLRQDKKNKPDLKVLQITKI